MQASAVSSLETAYTAGPRIELEISKLPEVFVSVIRVRSLKLSEIKGKSLVPFQKIFRCVIASLYEGLSLSPYVRMSVCPYVRDALSFHKEI